MFTCKCKMLCPALKFNSVFHISWDACQDIISSCSRLPRAAVVSNLLDQRYPHQQVHHSSMEASQADLHHLVRTTSSGAHRPNSHHLSNLVLHLVRHAMSKYICRLSNENEVLLQELVFYSVKVICTEGICNLG